MSLVWFLEQLLPWLPHSNIGRNISICSVYYVGFHQPSQHSKYLTRLASLRWHTRKKHYWLVCRCKLIKGLIHVSLSHNIILFNVLILPHVVCCKIKNSFDEFLFVNPNKIFFIEHTHGHNNETLLDIKISPPTWHEETKLGLRAARVLWEELGAGIFSISLWRA